MNFVSKTTLAKSCISQAASVFGVVGLSAIATLGTICVEPLQVYAATLILPEAEDVLQTVEDNTSFDLNLPEGFFGEMGGEESDPFSGTVFFKGVPLGPITTPQPIKFVGEGCHSHSAVGGKHCTAEPKEQGDTIIWRPTLELENVGNMQTVDIEIKELNLMGVAPISVTFGGGMTTLYNVLAELDPDAPQEDKMGMLKATRTGGNTADFEVIDLGVPTVFSFESLGKETKFLSVPGTVSTETPWQVEKVPVPEPSTVLALIVAGTGMLGWKKKRQSKK